ncbi:hypothetical protein A11A3_10107 [Alcanivorax hongdengensis A-11-3]|uniref:YhdP central domain-containing protein n=2 Tax=Alcanivorax hongdengensis TaxID=519051 RepID=L0WAX5_9GAMM|nr:hypothetical protein A11A3_10107 [Alcanivorax hongdengensis A-11-3]
MGSRRWWRRIQTWLLWLLAILALLTAVYVVVARQLMAEVPQYRERLISLLEERIKTPLDIGELNGAMDGLTPRFVARRIRLPAPEGEAPLELGEVVMSVDVLCSLLHRDLCLKELHIQGVDLQLVRDEQGKIRLRGLETLGGNSDDKPPVERLLTIFYRQQRLIISDARLSLSWPDMPPLAASSLNASLINEGSEHQLAVRLDARDRPLHLDVRMHLHGDAFRLQDVDADVYASVSGERLQEWLPQHRQWPLDVTALDGTVGLWATLEDGEPDHAQLQLKMPLLTFSDGQHQWPLKALQVNLALQRQADQAKLTVYDLAGQSPAGSLALGTATLGWQTRGDDRQWRLRVNDLPVHALAQQFLKWPFPLPEAVGKSRDLLAKLSPRGLVNAVYLQGHARELGQFQARVTGLTSQADDRIPGVSGLNGWLAGTPDNGLARLYGDNFSVTMPRLYDHALALNLDGLLHWQRQGDHLAVRSNRMQMGNLDAHGEAMMAVDLVAGQIPDLRLAAEIRDGDGGKANQYIPLQRLPDGLADWLGQAIRGGHLRRGQILYQGPVKIDKSRQQDRTLQMRYQGSNVSLSFLPDWPQATGIDADVLINGRDVSAVAARGQLFDSQLRDVYVDVPGVLPGQVPHLIISGQVSGPVKDLDALFQNTPLKQQLPAALTDWRFNAGSMDGHLLLDMPLKKGEGTPAVIVDARARDATVNNAGQHLAVTHLDAPVYFHLQKGIAIEHLTAQVMGGQFTGQWLTRDGKSRLQLDGKAPVKAVRDWLGFPWLEPVTGQMPLGITVDVPFHGGDFAVRAVSSMKGVSVNVPAPLGKGADETRPLDVHFRDAGAARQLTVSYGDQLSGAFRLGSSVAGELLLGPGKPVVPERGVAVHGQVAAASVEPWLDYLSDRLIPAFSGGGDGGGDGGLSDSRLARVSVKVGQLDLFDVPVADATVSAAPQGNDWNLALSSPSVAGSVRIPDGYTQRGDKPLQVSVSKLHIRLPDDSQDQGGPRLSPLQIPVMDVKAQNLRIDGEDFGQWRGAVRASNSGVRINDLQGQWRHTDFDGTLDWTAEDDGQYTRYNGALRSDNLGQALKDWDLPALIESKHATAKVVLGWHDWPFEPDYLALDGQANVDIGECRIPDTDTKTSFLRVLGVLNIGTIQRRLRLDFSDLYKKGLSCDGISGDFSINGPRVSTSNLRINSPSAAIEVKGEMNLDKETLNHQMKVTLPISSNLYAGCLAGPAACAGIFVVERIWGDKLDKTTTMEFKVTGNWSNPNVKETEGIF